MKKILLFLVLVFCVVSTVSAESPETFYGKWYLKYVSSEGIKLPADILGLSSSNIEITEDKAILTGTDNTKEGVWKQNTETSITATFPDREMEFVHDGECLTISNDDMVMYFCQSVCTCDCEALQAKIDELTTRIAELENGLDPQTKPDESASTGDFEQVIVDKYTLDYIDYELTKNYKNEDIINIRYTFTNNDEDSQSFAWAISTKAFQDGIELKDYYGTSNENGTEIRQGKSITVIDSFYLRSLTDGIDLEFGPLINLSGKPYAERYLNLD